MSKSKTSAALCENRFSLRGLHLNGRCFMIKRVFEKEFYRSTGWIVRFQIQKSPGKVITGADEQPCYKPRHFVL